MNGFLLTPNRPHYTKIGIQLCVFTLTFFQELGPVSEASNNPNVEAETHDLPIGVGIRDLTKVFKVRSRATDRQNPNQYCAKAQCMCV